MLKATLSALALCVMSTASYAQESPPAAFPNYDINARCEEKAADYPEMSEMQSACMKLETEAQAQSEALWADARPQIAGYCENMVNEAAKILDQTGSYAILSACLSTEERSYTEISEKWSTLPEASRGICQAVLESKDMISYTILNGCLEG